MRKLLIITAMLLFGFTNVNAQDEVLFGLRGGVNFSCITGDNVDSFDARTCFHIGAVLEVPISDKFSFQPEVQYSCQGADYEEEFFEESVFRSKSLVTYEGTVKLDYINVPLMAKYYVAEGLSLEAGPQAGFLLSAKDEFESPGDSGEEDIKDSLKGFDFGVNVGVGYKLEGGLNFGARYNFGLTDANDDTTRLDNSSYKNGVLQISLGYFF